MMQRRPWARQACLLFVVLCLAVLLAPPLAGAQTVKKPPRISKHDVAKVYRAQRLQLIVQGILGERGTRVPLRPPEHVASPSDTLLEWLARFYPGYGVGAPLPPPPLTIDRWQLVKRAERLQYEKMFNKVKWAYVGNNYFTPLDTTATRDLRARLQAHFGPPTRTLAEIDWSRNLHREEYIQFEYWFVLNDSIPLIVMDGNGPFDRGLVVSSDHRFREKLFELRQAFLRRIMEEGRFAPYVDYYYNYRVRRWYRTGFDGRHFFTEPIGQPNLARGRPRLSPEGR